MQSLIPAILAGLAFACQGFIAWVVLRIRAEQLEMKDRILDEVSKVYVRQDMCKKDMENAELKAKLTHGRALAAEC